ncbi:MAG: hypothetical protein M3Z21_03125 [Pseudomonadota bacterium]|nr:hypothetical protein [Pseudomonadota bacterium]
MIPLYQPDIDRFHQQGRKVTDVRLTPVKHKDQDWYSMVLTVEGINEPMQLVGQRGRPRLFREEKTALTFVKKWLPEIDIVGVKISRE